MLKKSIIGIVLAVSSTCQLSAQQVDPRAIGVGDQVVIELRGEASREYARIVGMAAPEADFSVVAFANVSRKIDDNNLELTYASPVRKTGADNRMVTITSVVDVQTIQSPSIYTAPQAGPPRNELEKVGLELQARREKLPIVQSTSLKNLLIRTWTMVDETGKL